MAYKTINNIQLGGVDTKDSPDFTDAFIISADYDSVEMSDKEIEELNNDSDFIHQCVQEQLF
jgi:hypothetical protein